MHNPFCATLGAPVSAAWPTCTAEHAADERGLAGPVGRGEAAGAAVLADRRAGQHRQGRRGAGRPALQHRDDAALAAPIAVRGRIKGLAAARRRERLRLAPRSAWATHCHAQSLRGHCCDMADAQQAGSTTACACSLKRMSPLFGSGLGRSHAAHALAQTPHEQAQLLGEAYTLP